MQFLHPIHIILFLFGYKTLIQLKNFIIYKNNPPGYCFSESKHSLNEFLSTLIRLPLKTLLLLANV